MNTVKFCIALSLLVVDSTFTAAFAGITITGKLMEDVSVNMVSPRISGVARQPLFAVYLNVLGAARSDGKQNDCRYYLSDKFGSEGDLGPQDLRHDYHKLVGRLVRLDNVRTTPEMPLCLFSSLSPVTAGPIANEVTGPVPDGVPSTSSPSAPIEQESVKTPNAESAALKEHAASLVRVRGHTLFLDPNAKPGGRPCRYYRSESLKPSDWKRAETFVGKHVRLTNVKAGKVGDCEFDQLQ